MEFPSVQRQASPGGPNRGEVEFLCSSLAQARSMMRRLCKTASAAFAPTMQDRVEALVRRYAPNIDATPVEAIDAAFWWVCVTDAGRRALGELQASQDAMLAILAELEAIRTGQEALMASLDAGKARQAVTRRLYQDLMARGDELPAARDRLAAVYPRAIQHGIAVLLALGDGPTTRFAPPAPLDGPGPVGVLADGRLRLRVFSPAFDGKRVARFFWDEWRQREETGEAGRAVIEPMTSDSAPPTGLSLGHVLATEAPYTEAPYIEVVLPLPPPPAEHIAAAYDAFAAMARNGGTVVWPSNASANNQTSKVALRTWAVGLLITPSDLNPKPMETAQAIPLVAEMAGWDPERVSPERVSQMRFQQDRALLVQRFPEAKQSLKRERGAG